MRSVFETRFNKTTSFWVGFGAIFFFDTFWELFYFLLGSWVFFFCHSDHIDNFFVFKKPRWFFFKLNGSQLYHIIRKYFLISIEYKLKFKSKLDGNI